MFLRGLGRLAPTLRCHTEWLQGAFGFVTQGLEQSQAWRAISVRAPLGSKVDIVGNVYAFFRCQFVRRVGALKGAYCTLLLTVTFADFAKVRSRTLEESHIPFPHVSATFVSLVEFSCGAGLSSL